MPLPVQLALFASGIAAFLVLAVTLRARRTEAALLLWLAPVFVMLPLSDWTMAALGRAIPAFAMDGQAGDGVRFSIVAFVVLCAVELSSQRLLTLASGTGVQHVAEDDAAGPPAAAEPASVEPAPAEPCSVEPAPAAPASVETAPVEPAPASP